MYHLKVVAANIAYLATEFFPKKEGMEKMERHFFAVRALVGYLGYPRRPQYFRIYSQWGSSYYKTRTCVQGEKKISQK